MLKKRIAAVLLVRNGIVVQSIGFGKYLPIGRPEIAVEFLNEWGIDEIILLDISATRLMKSPDIEMVNRVAKKCFVPLTVGGGITTLDHVRRLIRNGADKIAINQIAINSPNFINDVADIYGSQCVVASIDVCKTNNGKYQVFDYISSLKIKLTPEELAKKYSDNGAGEILLNSVDRDGSKAGFDLDLIALISESISVPVICCGGAALPSHFLEVFTKTNVEAAAAANFFHYTEHSVTSLKAFLQNEISIRHDTQAKYLGSMLDKYGRLLKKTDDELDRMKFSIIEKEII